MKEEKGEKLYQGAVLYNYNTQSWQCTAVESETEMGENAEIITAVEYLSSHFREPL